MCLPARRGEGSSNYSWCYALRRIPTQRPVIEGGVADRSCITALRQGSKKALVFNFSFFHKAGFFAMSLLRKRYDSLQNTDVLTFRDLMQHPMKSNLTLD